MSKHEARASLLSGSSSMDHPYYAPYAEQSYSHGGYAAREGLQPPSTPSRTERTKLLYVPHTKWTWAFFLVPLVQAIIGIAMEIWIFFRFQTAIRVHSHSLQSTVTTYLALFIFGFIYQLVLVLDALRLKNTIQIIGLCLYNIGLLVEAALQHDQFTDAQRTAQEQQGSEPLDPDFLRSVTPFVIALPAIMGLGTVLMAAISFKLYEEFSWSIYKNISADLRLKHRYLSYQIYLALLKFDFFFFLAFTVQFLVVVITTRDPEFWITLAAIPVTIVLLYMAGYWTRKENIYGMLLIIACYFGGLAYFLFKLVRMYYDPDNPQRVDQYKPTRKTLTSFAVITVALLLVTLVYAVICMANFNKGLKPHLLTTASQRGRRRANSSDIDKLYAADVPLAGPGPARMTID